MMTKHRKAFASKSLNVRVVILLQFIVTGVCILTEVLVTLEGLRMFVVPSSNLSGIDHHRVLRLINPRIEFCQHFFVVVFTDSRVESKVPFVHAANKVVSFDAAICQQRTAMKTATIQSVNVVAVSYHDQIDILNKSMSWRAVFQRAPLQNFCRLFVHLDISSNRD